MPARLPKKKRATYHKPICQPRRAVVDGITFDSQHEANVYGMLKLLERAKEIWGLELQVPYPLVVKEVLVATYIADFTFWEKYPGSPEPARGERFVVLDAKKFKTPVYQIKKKLMLAVHGIAIREE